MDHSTLLALLLANPIFPRFLALGQPLLTVLDQVATLLDSFQQQAPTPQATAEVERTLKGLVDAFARLLLEQTYNHLEPAQAESAAARLLHQGETYRRRPKSAKTVATLFGTFRLWRWLYEPLEAGEPCLHPLDRQLGLVAGSVTPALAEHLGRLAVQLPQRAVLQTVQRDQHVKLTHRKVRAVVRELALGLEEHRQEAQVQQVLAWLKQAHASKGPRWPVLAVGRDGIHVPVVDQDYREAATATVSVFDRRGQRLGTVYLGQMPEPGQGTLSRQLTELVREVLRRWPQRRLRLAYVTDAGYQPSHYYRKVLRRMKDPLSPERWLEWEWVVDFYHATQYISQLAEALFGVTEWGQQWAAQMRKRLQEKDGLKRVLQAATWYQGGLRLSKQRQANYEKAYRYLRSRGQQMQYARYRREGLPLGSGVTEAACKVLFTQRLKQSGMQWKTEGGQAIVTLRVLWLSGVWEESLRAYWTAQIPYFQPSYQGYSANTAEKAA